MYSTCYTIECTMLYLINRTVPLIILGVVEPVWVKSVPVCCNQTFFKNKLDRKVHRGGYLEDNKCKIAWKRANLNDKQWIIVKILHILFRNYHINVLCTIFSKDLAKWLGMFCFNWWIPNRRWFPHLHVHIYELRLLHGPVHFTVQNLAHIPFLAANQIVI